MSHEFALIKHYFQQIGMQADLAVPNGDDAAVLNVPAGQQLVACTDMLVSGRHFPEATSPFAIGWKAIAVNLSDLAAMGAQPDAVLLAIGLPPSEPDWLNALQHGLEAICAAFNVRLIGGDTTRSALLTLTVTALGWVPPGQALTRGGAQPGDLIYVSGTLGDAAYALAHSSSDLQHRLDCPQPRVGLGLALRGLATAALDISDGLWQDLGHIAQASHVSMSLQAERLPLAPPLRQLPPLAALRYALTGGDDYELAFCIPPRCAKQVQDLADTNALPLTCIGQVQAALDQPCVEVHFQGKKLDWTQRGYQHF